MTMVLNKKLLLLHLLIFLPLDAVSPPVANRRQVVKSAAMGLCTPFIISGQTPASSFSNAGGSMAKNDDELLKVPKEKSILVLGANGKTGRECVSVALEMHRPCVATTRSGLFEWEGLRENLTVGTVDVSIQDSIDAAIALSGNIGAVIFAASASASSNTDPFRVDRDGLIHAAKSCIAAGVPRLIVVSSGTVTRPDSAVYKLLNTVGHGIMEAKIEGENVVRELYADPQVLQRKLGYTIIRPGGLTSGVSLGPGSLELNQGDSKSGRLSRSDVAYLCVNALDSSATFDSTFECYETTTGKPIEAVGLSNILKLNTPTLFQSGFERQGETWNALFDGLRKDVIL
jgi:uncharacterized protein YbjT (DUF2867 family)